jgi:hypothetical protein
MSMETVTVETSGMLNGAVSQGMGIWQDILAILGGSMEYIKPVLGAIAILIIGKIIIKYVLKALSKILEKVKIDDFLNKIGLTGELNNLGISISASSLVIGIIGFIAKFVLWMAAINTLNITALTDLMNKILVYIPNVIVSLILLIAGITIAKFAKDIVEKSTSSLSVSKNTSALFGKIVRVAIITLTIMAVLTQLNIATELVETLFNGIVYGLTIAGGIAFGLGGQDRAKEIINKIGK